MAVNSIREQIISNVILTLENIPSIARVSRVKLGFGDLSSVPQTQMPYVSLSAGLPSGSLKRDSTMAGKIGRIISELNIEITVYGQDNINPDQSISSLVDDVWKELYLDPNRGELAMSTEIKTDLETGIFSPYYAFSLQCIVTYIHGVNGI